MPAVKAWAAILHLATSSEGIGTGMFLADLKALIDAFSAPDGITAHELDARAEGVIKVCDQFTSVHIYTYIHVRTYTHIHIYAHTHTKCTHETHTSTPGTTAQQQTCKEPLQTKEALHFFFIRRNPTTFRTSNARTSLYPRPAAPIPLQRWQSRSTRARRNPSLKMIKLTVHKETRGQ